MVGEVVSGTLPVDASSVTPGATGPDQGTGTLGTSARTAPVFSYCARKLRGPPPRKPGYRDLPEAHRATAGIPTGQVLFFPTGGGRSRLLPESRERATGSVPLPPAGSSPAPVWTYCKSCLQFVRMNMPLFDGDRCFTQAGRAGRHIRLTGALREGAKRGSIGMYRSSSSIFLPPVPG